MQFMVDCLVMLEHRSVERVSSRGLRIVKFRGSSFLANEVPFVIGPAGIDVPSVTELPQAPPASTERVSTGIARLDAMLRGGYFCGSSILISGTPGTAKSTLSGAFVEAAGQRGERALYLSFDEEGPEIVRNLASVNIHLAPHIKAGRLKIVNLQIDMQSADEHLLTIQTLLKAHRPQCLVIDPMSALVKAGGVGGALDVALQILRLANRAGITVVCTSLLSAQDPEFEATALPVSTVADTWIHLSYVVRGGERNRALTVVKSRGTGHSNQVRELVLSDAGVTLADVYSARGEVLMGTARWEKEQAELLEQRQREEQQRDRRRELARSAAELQSRLALLQLELESKQAELESLTRNQDQRQQDQAGQREKLLRLREGAEADSTETSDARPARRKRSR